MGKLLFRTTFVLFFCSLGLSAGDHEEIVALKSRIAELEKQNRQILELLLELKAKPDLSSTKTPAAVAVAAPAPARATETAGSDNRLKFYGWLRMDTDIDSQRPNNGETPLYITSPVSRGANDQGLLSMHPRLTRFGMDLRGPELEALGGALLTGKLETDFENGGSESREIIRVRQAYFQLQWGKSFSILGGQAWDVFSPLLPTPNNDTLMWNAGNLGDRRPQFRAEWLRKVGGGTLSLTGAAGLTGAIDGLDLTADNYLDGQESGLPNLQSRVGYSHPVFEQNLSFGVSTFSAWMNTSKPVAGRNSFRSQGTNIDVTFPLNRMVSLRGEGWWGRNLSDVRGGAGQGINTATGREIRGRGGWGEFNIKVSRFWSVNPGFTTDDPVDADIPNGGRTRNQAFYFANRFTPSPSFTIGADFLRWKTDYKVSNTGIDNRVNLFFYYAF